MRTLGTCLAAFAAAAVLAMGGCGSRIPAAPDAPGGEGADAADAVVRGVEFVEADGDRTQYRVLAERAVYSDDERTVTLREITAWIYATGGRAYEVRSPHGTLEVDSGDMRFAGKVTGTTSDGVELEGRDFRYDAEAEVVSSAERVRVRRPGAFVLDGMGFRAYPREERFEVVRAVTGQVQRP